MILIMEEIKGDTCFTVLDNDTYNIFYFTAEWCGPCQEKYPNLLKLLETIDKTKIKMYKIDISEEENNEICEKCYIKSVPTFLLFKDRTYIDKVNGADIDKLLNMIKMKCVNNI